MEKFYDNKPNNSMVRGHYWNCRMSNDAIFSIWTPYIGLSRKEIKEALLDYSNGGGVYNAYTSEDIIRIWKSINPANLKD